MQAALSCICPFISGCGGPEGGVCSELQACQHRIRRQRKLCWFTGVVCLVLGVQGWGLSVGGLSPVAVPLPCFLHTPCKAGLLHPNVTSGAWKKGGDRRLGQGRGVGGGGGEGGRESWRQAGPEARQMLATQEQQPGLRAFFCLSSRVPFAGPSRGLSSGPTKDDVDLPVLHALGRSEL